MNNEIKSCSALCSVCIATYRRPHLLERLLDSLNNQELPKGVSFEIITVDNDLQKSAQPVVHKFQQSSCINTHYFSQPIKNISTTRNLAVEKSSGDFILFIDDDEIASPRWIYHLWKTINKFSADGVFGPVMPEFDGANAKKLKYIGFNAVSRTGAKAIGKWTGNCILRANLLKKMNGPFDPRYGITGGEDTLLFDKLEKKGARFVYCQNAPVFEYWPASRTRSSYIFLRGLQNGNDHTRRLIEFADRKWITRSFMIVKAGFYGISSLLLMGIFCLAAARRTYWLLKLGSNIGRFMAVFGWHYKAYR